MRGRCCWPASTRCSRCAAPNAGALCGSSPASPRRRRCATSSAPSANRSRHPPSPRPAARHGGRRRTMPPATPQRATPARPRTLGPHPLRTSSSISASPGSHASARAAMARRGGGSHRLPPTDLKSARQHRMAARSTRESAAPPRGRRIISARSPLDQRHQIRNTRVRAAALLSG